MFAPYKLFWLRKINKIVSFKSFFFWCDELFESVVESIIVKKVYSYMKNTGKKK